MVLHADYWWLALVWTIGKVLYSVIPSSSNIICPLEKPPGNLPSQCLSIEALSPRLYTLALVAIF